MRVLGAGRGRRHCEAAGILSLFDAVVVAAEVPKGKPHPDVFLRAAELIGADPAFCRAYEVPFFARREFIRFGLSEQALASKPSIQATSTYRPIAV